MWLSFGSFVALTQIIGLKKRLTQSETKKLSLQNQAAKLEQLATLDPLTQLYNRRGMRPHASRALEELKQLGNKFSLIMFDIDNFKALNDRHGHGYGDKILQHVAAVVGEHLSENDSLARWGGEEFLVICKSTELEKASRAGVEFSEALDLVDHCLYQAKNSGRNCVKAARSNSFEKSELVESSGTN